MSWQRRTPGVFQAGGSAVAWDERRVRCPEGKENVRWGEFENAARGRYVKICFKAEDCLACGSRARCTRSISAGRRLYALRQRVEATFSQGVRAFGLRRMRYRGLTKTRLQHVATAAALNLTPSRFGCGDDRWRQPGPRASQLWLPDPFANGVI